MKIIQLSDIHFGPRRNNQAIDLSLKQCVYPYIEKVKPDLILCAGDDTDDRLSLDQISARMWLDFVNTLSNFKNKNKPIPVRFIAGTESHQRGQLQALSFLENDVHKDVKTYNTVGDENVLGLNILYVPEESVQDKHKYYKKYLYGKKKYGFATGHGTFDFVTIGGWGEDVEKGIRGAPIWSIDDFANIEGPVCFGHVHNAMDLLNKIFYGGSLNQLCFGEDKPKGFLEIDININNTNDYKVSRIPNPYSPKFNTIILGKKQALESAEKIIKDVETYQNKHQGTTSRIIIHDGLVDRAKLSIIKNYFAHNKQLMVKVVVKKSKEIDKDSVKEQNTYASKFKSIKDPEDWVGNTIEYVKTQFNKGITSEQINSIMTKAIAYGRGEKND